MKYNSKNKLKKTSQAVWNSKSKDNSDRKLNFQNEDDILDKINYEQFHTDSSISNSAESQKHFNKGLIRYFLSDNSVKIGNIIFKSISKELEVTMIFNTIKVSIFNI